MTGSAFTLSVAPASNRNFLTEVAPGNVLLLLNNDGANNDGSVKTGYHDVLLTTVKVASITDDQNLKLDQVPPSTGTFKDGSPWDTNRFPDSSWQLLFAYKLQGT